MLNLIPSLIATNIKSLSAGEIKRQQRIADWPYMKTRALVYFECIVREWIGSDMPLPSISVIDSTKRDPKDKSPQAIHLMFSKQKTGFTTLEDNDKHAIERGCQLVISQDVFGSVACTIYPAESELHQHRKKYTMVGFYKDPCRLTDLELDNITKIFFAWQQMTSISGSPRFIDKYRVVRSRISHFWIHINIWSQASKLASSLLTNSLRLNN